jgi:hypothetical protein
MKIVIESLQIIDNWQIIFNTIINVQHEIYSIVHKRLHKHIPLYLVQTFHKRTSCDQ